MILKTEQPNGRLGVLISHSDRLLVVQPGAAGGFAIELWGIKGALSVSLDRAEVARIIEVLTPQKELVLDADSKHECTGCTMQTDHNGQCVCRGCDQPYGPRR